MDCSTELSEQRQVISTANEKCDYEELAKEHHLARHEVAELVAAFRAIDADGSGSLDVSEFMDILSYALPYRSSIHFLCKDYQRFGYSVHQLTDVLHCGHVALHRRRKCDGPKYEPAD
jgi:Ca2+-binding EF-hand superfamily protein